MSTHSVPNVLLGLLVTSAAEGNHRIGIEIELSRESRDKNMGDLRFPVDCRFFVNPPTVFVCDTGALAVNLSSRSATLASESGFFQFDAQFSEDFQTLQGRADIVNFQLMDITGTFRDCGMILEADNDSEMYD